jgi:hypothetical protein
MSQLSPTTLRTGSTFSTIGAPGYRLAVAGAGGDDSDASRPLVASGPRPYWWGVLAVLLALMALVLASTTTGRSESATASTGSAHAMSLPPHYGSDVVARTYDGALEYPFIRTESFWQGARRSGTERAVVDGPTTDHLRLIVDCPGSQRTSTGTDRLAVTVSSGGGRCMVTIVALPSYGPLPFHLTMERTKK